MLSISLSLIAVFIPILLMGGIVGRLFREFAMTLSVAILVSLVDLADDHADDVRAAAAADAAAASRADDEAGRVRPRAGVLRANAELGAAAFGAGIADTGGDGRG